MEEGMSLKGFFELKNLTTGETRQVPNTIVTVGKSTVASFIAADVSSGSAFDWMAIGVGSSTIAAGDTVLGSEAYRINTVGSQITTTVTNDTARFTGSFVIDESKSINEAGMFNMSGLDTGSMLSRTTFATLSVGSEDVIQGTWDIIVG